MGYITLEQAKAYLKVTTISASDETFLTDAIERATARIESITHRSFEASSDTTRRFHLHRDISGNTLWFDKDLCQITSVENAGSIIPASAYHTEPTNETPYYAITLLQTTSHTWDYADGPENAISVTGRWAFSITPPADIRQATYRLMHFFYRERDVQVLDRVGPEEQGAQTIPAGTPRDVWQLLRPYTDTGRIGGYW